MTATTTTEYAVLTGEYTFDPNHTRLGFSARHAMVTKVRGSFNAFTGTVSIEGEHPENSSVRVNVDVNSVDTRNEMRDNHLRSNDFLDIANHPHITFASTDIKHVGGNDFEVTGELTIKGVTRTVTLPVEYQGSATDPFGNQRIGFEGSTVINRTDFGVTYNAALETGGVLVGDKITLEFEVSAIKTA